MGDEQERAGTDGMAGEVGASVVGNDADGRAREPEKERGVGLLQMEDDGTGVRRFDRRDHAEAAPLGRSVGGIQDEVESGFYVRRGDEPAVVKVDARAEMKNIGKRVGSLPRSGEVGVNVHLIVALDQRGEEQPVEVLGLAVSGESRVEVGGIRFDEEG